MGRYLMLDVGAGTLDILYYDTDSDFHYTAVVRSPVRVLADDIRQTTGHLVVTGSEMGGGPVSQALIDRAKSADVVMSRTASATIHHDVRRVTTHGIRVVDTTAAVRLKLDARFNHIRTGDIQIDRLKRLVQGFGVPFEFDAVAVCAQDHGAAPAGVSHLDFRHRMFTAVLEANPVPQALLYRADQIPVEMNRLSAIAADAAALPTDRIYVMDSGMAAILGASKDMSAAKRKKIIVLDIATSHTVGAALMDNTLYGFFEYHTQDVTAARLDELLKDLPNGQLSHEQILDEGGHGAYCRDSFGYDNVELILATGPRRRMAMESTLPITYGAPWGDNMMTGTVGLLEAVRQREGLAPIAFV